MSAGTLKALLVAVLGLGFLWLVISFLPRGGAGPAEPSAELSGFFDGLVPEATSALRFTGPGGEEPVELSRSGGAWTVNGFRADSANLARFWDAVADVQVGDVVATNPANHARMGVASDSAWRVEAQVSGESRALLMGNSGTRFGTAFVRLPDEDAVHLLEGNLRSQITRSLDAWRNKRVAAVDGAAVARVEVERDEGPFVLERSDSLWLFPDGAEADSTAVRNLLSEMARLEASGFYEAGDSLSALGATLRALGLEGDTLLSLEIGAGDGERWVRASGDSILYRVPAWRANRLLPELEAVQGGG